MAAEDNLQFSIHVLHPNFTHTAPPELAPEDDMATTYLALTLHIVTKYLWMVVVIVGIPGNLLSLAISLQKDNRKVSTCTYMAALSIADTQKLIVTAWAYSVMFWTNQLGVYHIRTIWYVGYTAAILSGFYLTEMSIDRLIAVKYPMSVKTRCTTTKAIRMVLISMVVVAVLNVHILLTYNYEGDEETGQLNVHPVVPEYPIIETIILAYHLSFGTLLPFVLIVVCNIWIILTLRGASKDRSKMGVDAKNKRSQAKETAHLTRMLIIVCFAYVITSIPYRMYDLVIAIPPIKALYDLDVRYWHVRYTCQHWVILHFWEWNYGINFYLYCVGGGKKYRNDVKNLLKRMICPRKVK